MDQCDRRVRVRLDEMERFAATALTAVGADLETRDAVIAVLSHASLHGVDTHGYRLLPHYLEGFRKGRLNPRPAMSVIREKSGAAVLDADDAHGARATLAAVDLAIELAREFGVGAVAIRASSHFGAAGSYALRIAQSGMMGLAVCNSDSFVRLHGGAEAFHGTNPIAAGFPAGPGENPWLLDMATSAIPFNKVKLNRSLGISLPEATASNALGLDVTDPHEAAMLAPLGGLFGYKGAGLAGMIDLLSAGLSGAKLSHELAPMLDADMTTPRGLGAFVLALYPEAFAGLAVLGDTLRRYRSAVHGSAVAAGQSVMAAGDREWAEGERRTALGILLDSASVDALNDFARQEAVPELSSI